MVPQNERARSLADVLAESLASAIGDPIVADRLVVEALRHASRASLPRDREELLSFVWAHLVPLIVKPLGAAIVSSFVDALRANLDAEDDPRRVHARETPGSMPKLVPASSPAMAVAVAPAIRPPSSTREMPTPSSERALVQMPLSTAPPISSGVRTTKRTVLIVDSDRFRRVNLARQLIRAGIDVIACDAKEAMREHAATPNSIDAVLVAEGGRDASDFLEAIGTADPSIPVIGWTRNIAATDVMLRSYGLTSVVVVSSADSVALERALLTIRKRRHQ